MIIIPIGRDESEIRRHAWISYSILTLNILSFILVNFNIRSNYQPIQAKWNEAMEYLVRHPYLTIPDGLRHLIPPAAIPQLETARTIASPPAEGIAAAEQERLDKLAAELGELIHASPLMRYAYVPANPSWMTLITSMFLHADFFHLLGNLLFFFVTAPFVEDVFGRPLFALLYFTGGFVATWTHVWQHPGSQVPLVGASGAIAAVMGAYLIRFYKSKLEFFFIPFVWRPTLYFRFFLPAFVVLPLWFISQFYLATTETDVSSVAVWSHVGGFCYGLAFAGILLWLKVEDRWVNPVVEKQISWQQNEHLILAEDARAKGDLDLAHQELELLLRYEPDNVDARRSGFEIGVAKQDWNYAAQNGMRLLDLYGRLGEERLAADFLEGLSRPAIEHLPARFFLKAGAYLERHHEREWALGMYHNAAAADPSREEGFRALVAAAKLFRQAGDAGRAREALMRARSHPACNAEWHETITAQIANLS